ncbi:MAG: 50S ribosomal protein L11 [Candidatus Colwellbacteria bacterium RIFCSPHIGHO2_12_FULL_43_12]|uniref:Large ribosomal subunit protein uL11 n=3 Tax=Candidatus Colwelliibacteriota TaxID=1817904 RepID=A0A1G1YY43_9BACT|nr:MAG: 50S ribosomal protein L11 [Candidatus Colwellbacteria bacterium RIFCSPHIGHO2_02_FULL_43_15]OGY58369.1 MAG: 50S ribosomal protein L11 [Candidatus Colwellbacteria bacterium RIFCSPHIGHO2_12_FULL_43_12]OGY61294.1 MAG: 50S ribosomal protein L11 [Candidatus Colwellbacteria bacterium RIFCSPLOWO2_12_FULL_43_11]
MAAKKIKTTIKIQIPAAKANPAPPIGTALGPQGVNIQEFCKQFNEATKDMGTDIVPAEITIFEDRSFTFKLRTPPASDLIRKAAGIEKGSGVPNKNKVGKITKADLRKIAERKMADLNAYDLPAAEKIIAGTARSMGVELID